MATLSLSTSMTVRWTRQIADPTKFQRVSNVPGPAVKHMACMSCLTQNTCQWVSCQRTLSALAPESRVLRLLQRPHQTQRRDQACIDRQRPGSRTSTRMAASWMEETTYLCRLAIDTRQV